MIIINFLQLSKIKRSKNIPTWNSRFSLDSFDLVSFNFHHHVIKKSILGVPIIQLDMQGRARPTICELYNWRYEKLGNLPHTSTWPEFRFANAGLVWDYQLIDVGDFNGVGESEPSPHFFQNLAEAEYCVALFMYMRLLGYPAEKISILTTYNGQKHLIRDVIENRCANNPLIGRPSKVTTVDRFQGKNLGVHSSCFS